MTLMNNTMIESKDKKFGVIYPLLIENFNKLAQTSNPIYVKFLGNRYFKTPTRLKKNDYLFFYLSHYNKTIIGYSIINEILLIKPLDLNNQIMKSIQMNKNEFQKYIKGREDKYLICLKLKKIINLQEQMRVNYPITMAGRYVVFNEIEDIKDQENIKNWKKELLNDTQ